MKDRGLEMISLLTDVHVGHNPITWVGHSKGGLFIKQILEHGTNYSGSFSMSNPTNICILILYKIIILQLMKTSKTTES